MRLIVTGGLGFIGSAVVRHFAADPQHTVLNIDKCTYAGNPASVETVSGNDNYSLLQTDPKTHRRQSMRTLKAKVP